MDFRTCPACKASVLEDDVEDCPFCGASMSGKPSAKPPAKPAAGKPVTKPSAAGKPAAPAKPGAPAAKPAPPAKGRPAHDDDDDHESTVDDPFEVDSLAHQQASPVSPKAGKGRTIEVKCPMCDTTGYIAPSQYGKQIKCCNPGCRMPIYKAPPAPIVKEEVVQSKGLSTPVLALLSLLGVGLVGGAIWYFLLREEPKPVIVDENPVPGTNDPVPDVPDPTNDVIVVKEPPPATLPEVQRQSLKAMLDAALKRDGVRNKPLARQLVAEAYLLAGEKAQAAEQIDKLKTLDKNTVFYAVTPHAMQAEIALRAGDKAGADAALLAAMELVEKLPDVGRPSLDSVAILASALVQADRLNDAKTLVGRYARDDQFRNVMTALWRDGLDSGTFDLAAMDELQFHEFGGRSLWVTTTGRLCAQGQWEKALAWAKAAPEALTADACHAAWAAVRTKSLLRKPDPAAEAALTAAISAASPSARMRMTAAAAQVRLQAGDRAGAEKLRDTLVELVNGIKIPTASTLPSMRAIYESKGKPFAGLTDPQPGKSLALAMADLSSLQIQLGDKAAGWATLQKSLEQLRSVSPGPLAVQQLLDQCANNATIVKDLLERDLKLERQETKRIAAFNQYRAQAQIILNEAQSRFALQSALLMRAARAGLLTEVWGEVVARSEGDINQLEPYRMESGVPLAVWLAANTYGQKEMFKTIDAAYDKKKRPKGEAFQNDPLLVELAKLESMTSTPKMESAGAVVAGFKNLYAVKGYDRQVIDRAVLVLISRLARQDLAMAFEYARRLSDQPIREDALRMLAGWSVVQGQGPAFWKILDSPGAKDLQPLDKVALYLGLVEGIQFVEPAPAAK